MNVRGPTDIKLLALDYDNCAFTLYSSHPQLLSPALIQYVKQVNYEGFYGCTHRSFSMLPILRKNALNKAVETGHTVAVVAECFPTYKVTENFEREARLDCLAVSTVDDLLGKACGDSFVEIITPYEQDGTKPGPEMRYVSIKDYSSYTKSKNDQLCQVAQHAVQLYPDMRITLDFIDDKKSLCQQALTAADAVSWPRNVSLKVFRHLADSDHAPITPVTLDDKKRKQVDSGVGAFGMYAPPPLSIAAAVQAEQITRATRSGKKF